MLSTTRTTSLRFGFGRERGLLLRSTKHCRADFGLARGGSAVLEGIDILPNH